MEHIKCPVCGNTDMLSRTGGPNSDSWLCGCCDTQFAERLAKREYEKLEAAIEAGLENIGSVVSEALKNEKRNEFDNLRFQLIKKVKSDFINSKAVVQICRQILAIVPDDFLAEFFEIANSASYREVAEYINGIDENENAVYMELVLDFIIKSLKEDYIVATSALLDRCGRILSPEKKAGIFHTVRA